MREVVPRLIELPERRDVGESAGWGQLAGDQRESRGDRDPRWVRRLAKYLEGRSIQWLEEFVC